MSKTKLQERARHIQAKRAELAKLFSDSKNSEGEYDLSVDQIKEVNDRNAELTTLAKEYEELKAALEIEEKNLAEIESLRQGTRLPVAGNKDAEMLGALGLHHPGVGFGDAFVKSRTFAEYKSGSSRGPLSEVEGVHVKTLMTTSAGWAPETTRTGRVVLSAQRPIRVVDIIPDGETNQAAVVYMQEDTFTNNAAETAEGGTFGEAALVLSEQSSTVRKIATFLPVTDEQMADEAGIRSYVNNRLGYMIQVRLDSQLLVGNGTAPNLRGVNNASGIQTQAKGADPTPDAIYKAMVLVMVNGRAMPSACVMHPLDWQDIRLLRTADGIYIWGNPADAGPERIWGLPVVITDAQTQNTAIVGDFAGFSQLYMRQGIEFEVTNSHGTFFVEGKLAIRATIRAAFVVYRGSAFCTVTGI